MDDWENEDFEAVPAPKIMSAPLDDWEEEANVLPSASTNHEAASEKKVTNAKKETKVSGPKETVIVKDIDEEDLPCEDPAEEKRRLQRRMEESDMAIANDLFSGFTAPQQVEEKSTKRREITKIVEKDSFEELELKVTKDIETLASRVSQKLSEAKPKSSLYTFMLELLKNGGDALQMDKISKLKAELVKLETVLKKEQQQRQMTKQKKQTGDVSNMKNGAKFDYSAEYDDMYGYAEYDDYEDAY